MLAKALQVRVQSLLKNVISSKQSAFLPLRYILDNVLLQYETIEWIKDSDQDLIFLKLDFMKAFDVILWDFLIRIMGRFGILDDFTRLVKMPLQDASAAVSLNGKMTKSFTINWGVRQGCPLAPYLFLLVGESLNMAAKEE